MQVLHAQVVFAKVDLCGRRHRRRKNDADHLVYSSVSVETYAVVMSVTGVLVKKLMLRMYGSGATR